MVVALREFSATSSSSSSSSRSSNPPKISDEATQKALIACELFAAQTPDGSPLHDSLQNVLPIATEIAACFIDGVPAGKKPHLNPETRKLVRSVCKQAEAKRREMLDAGDCVTCVYGRGPTRFPTFKN